MQAFSSFDRLEISSATNRSMREFSSRPPEISSQEFCVLSQRQIRKLSFVGVLCPNLFCASGLRPHFRNNFPQNSFVNVPNVLETSMGNTMRSMFALFSWRCWSFTKICSISSGNDGKNEGKESSLNSSAQHILATGAKDIFYALLTSS